MNKGQLEELGCNLIHEAADIYTKDECIVIHIFNGTLETVLVLKYVASEGNLKQFSIQSKDGDLKIPPEQFKEMFKFEKEKKNE